MDAQPVSWSVQNGSPLGLIHRILDPKGVNISEASLTMSHPNCTCSPSRLKNGWCVHDNTKPVQKCSAPGIECVSLRIHRSFRATNLPLCGRQLRQLHLVTQKRLCLHKLCASGRTRKRTIGALFFARLIVFLSRSKRRVFETNSERWPPIYSSDGLQSIVAMASNL